MPKQHGGGNGLGVVFLEFYKNGRILDTKALKDSGDPLFDDLDMAMNEVYEDLIEVGFIEPDVDIVDLYDDVLTKYPPLTAILMEYPNTIPPELPDPIDYYGITIKFVNMSTYVEAIDSGADAGLLGAGAGPAVLRNHETRYVDGKFVYIATIPKGTLLFRGLKDVNSMYHDLLGYKSEEAPDDEPRTLNPPYNVFFYPFPIVDRTVGWYQTVIVYVLHHDVKVASLINPSPYARNIRHTKNGFIESCKDPDHDPCFTNKFMVENPDVTGIVAISALDSKRARFMSYFLTPEFKNYCFIYEDSRGEWGFPEIILYPRRTLNNTKTMNSKDLAEIIKEIPELTFIPYHIMPHRSEEKLATIIDAGMAGSSMKDLIGFDDELFIDKTTGFYISKLNYTGDPSRLSKDRSAKSFDNLTFRPKPIDFKGGRRRTRRRKYFYG